VLVLELVVELGAVAAALAFESYCDEAMSVELVVLALWAVCALESVAGWFHWAEGVACDASLYCCPDVLGWTAASEVPGAGWSSGLVWLTTSDWPDAALSALSLSDMDWLAQPAATRPATASAMAVDVGFNLLMRALQRLTNRPPR
jgi:hypothetical protein